MTQTWPPRAYELTFEQHPAFLLADVRCDDGSLEVKKAYLTEIGEKCVELGAARVLIDRRVPTAVSNIESHLAIDAFAEASPAGLRAAIVDTNELSRQRLIFGVRTAEPKEIVINVFDDRNDAESWLTE